MLSKKSALSLLVLIAVLLTACSLVPPPPPGSFPDHILFIGTSFTYYNEGVDKHLQGMATSDMPPLPVQTASATLSATPLSGLWQSSAVQDKIQEGNWDVVVIQGRLSMGEDAESYEEYVRKFDELIRSVGARPVLLMNWQTNFEGKLAESYPQIMEIAQVTSRTGAVVNAEVAPVGLAWERALAEDPDIELFSDYKHPNMQGTYLTAAVLYATIFDRSPVGLSFRPTDLVPDPDAVDPKFRAAAQALYDKYLISEENAEFLQRIAWETVQDSIRQGEESADSEPGTLPATWD